MRKRTLDSDINLILGERLAASRKRAGLAQVELAVGMGDRYNQQMVSQVELGQSSLRLDGLAAAARELNVSTDYLLGLIDDPRPLTLSSQQVRGTYHPVEILEIASAAGGGADVYDEAPIGVMWFRKDWLHEKGINPVQCNIISVAGDSMEPTLPEGCSILVDRSRCTLYNRRIYVLRNEGGLIVKRVQHTPKNDWLLISDNTDWSIEVMDDGTDVIGEVRWYAVTL